MEPLVTIVTVAFNSEKTIEKTIKSVLNQTYPKIEYLIIDGKSGDQTVEIAKTYEEQALKKGYSYRIVSEKDRGIYDAMNKGIALAKGEIMGFINSDDWYEKDAVALSVKTMLKKQCDITFGDIAIHKADGSRIVKRAKLSRYETSRHWNHPTMFVKTSVYRDFPFRQKGIHDDYGAYLAMKKAGKKVEAVHRVLANFSMGGASNKRSLKLSVKRIKDRYGCYRDNGYGRWYFLECILMEAGKFILG